MEEFTISVEELQQKVRAIFLKAGLDGGQAEELSKVIVASERDACKSHGIYRIQGVLRSIKAGKVAMTAVPKLVGDTDNAIVRVDAKGGFANPAFALGLPHLVERARRFGLAALVINDCVHLTALWPEVEAITDEGLAALIMCPSYATVAPAGGTHPLLGTNPLAFGWPRNDRNPYVFDFATSIAARGEIELHQLNGKQLPVGWALDSNGAPTTDPAAALKGAMLPFGGHKGSAIATMIELMAGIMIGDLTSEEALSALGTTALAPRHGELVLAFSPKMFSATRTGDPFERAELFFDRFVGQGARLPSQRRYMARALAEEDGISLTVDECELLSRYESDGLAAV